MPSWNIHTAHVERLLAECPPEKLGIGDANAFLFGNFVPDIYVGYMVPDASLRIDYRITHVTPAYMVPMPDADHFWDSYFMRFLPKTAAGLSLLLGAWAHLSTDRMYNARFRAYCRENGIKADDALRVRKQSDYALFGRSLPISSHVQLTPELFEAAHRFPPYTILEDDVRKAVAVADEIVASNVPAPSDSAGYQEVSAAWMAAVFEQCNERLGLWLKVWQQLGGSVGGISAAEIRETAGLAPATFDDPNWMNL